MHKHTSWTSLNRWYAKAAYQENFKHIKATRAILAQPESMQRTEQNFNEVLRHMSEIKKLQDEYDKHALSIRRAFFKHMEG
jgi:histidinol phosphatase-like PHP family hydrolase